ncbi:MAG: glycosyltransferase family 4 protein [Actinomycetota bacterium]|nr:glycosyltransferase family 4 protein [Actinomycetota bacterium]MDD5668373.1 glycosyltransferase family 4 protein [Actinomycetota bacterium]
MMKILIFNWRDIKHPNAGGAEIGLHEQAKRWVNWGYRVGLFTSRPKGSPAYDVIDGVEVYRAGGFYSVYARAATAYLSSLRRDTDVILDSINGIPFFTPAYASKPSVGLMHHVHSDQFLVEMGPLLGHIGRTVERCFPLLARYDTVICISQSTADDMRKYLINAERLPLKVVYYGIDKSFYTPGEEKFERPTIIYLGRVKRYKRLERLISAMPAIRREVPDAELIIAGTGDYLENIEAMVEEKHMGEFIRFLGYVSEEEKLDLLRKAWVLAMPSMNEGWGMNVIEANACGTPCVAFRVPGLKESISHGGSGFLADDQGQFTDYLIKIIKEPSLRNSLSGGAVDWASRFDWDKTARQTLDILESVARA